VHQAFILGAGLGTRLRPLTDRLPKPLVPLFHRPLAAWALDACARQGIRRFAINTHHLPEEWNHFVALRENPAYDIRLFHEPVLLGTGGGLKNIAPWIEDAPLLVHNGDIFATLPLEELIAAHSASGLAVTLALRSAGSQKHIALDGSHSLVTDIHQQLGRAPGTHVFTGIYCINPEFLDLIPQGQSSTVIPAFLHLARQMKLGAVVIDGGEWLDLGDRDSYLQAHRRLGLAPAIHPLARIEPGAVVKNSVIGPGAVVGPKARITGSVVWPGATICGESILNDCVVYSLAAVKGHHRHAAL
jgi:mannose-1-phosphate guanylyltransferase